MTALPLAKWAPPLTRGSTFGRECPDGFGGGSPAYAGIDRLQDVRKRASPWLPRLRGDRPVTGWAPDGAALAPPLTRGSTVRGALLLHFPHGSPVYAGIDPPKDLPLFPGARLPRLRGDRPGGKSASCTTGSAPPLTRGSTRPPRDPPAEDRGSPAYAGIDPRLGRPRERYPWLPRLRGDRPVERPMLTDGTVAPPLTRESTRVTRTGPSQHFSRISLCNRTGSTHRAMA